MSDIYDNQEKETNIKSKEKKIYTLDLCLNHIEQLSEKVNDQYNKVRVEGLTDKNYFNEYLRSMKRFIRDLKDVKRIVVRTFKQKRKRTTNPNTKSGFKKIIKVSDATYKFTGWVKEDKYCRNDVTRYMCSYIKDKNLQNEKDKREIIPDKKLATYLGYKKKDGKLTYCNMQCYLKKHFI